MAKKTKPLIDVSSDIIKQAREKLWNKGNLEWKLSATQKKINDYFKHNSNKILVLSASRRLGKSHILITYAIQVCLAGPNKIVKYVLPEQKMARTIIKPLMRELLKDCPENLQPKYSSIDAKYIFPNGSEIQLAGSDAGNADRLRGTDANLCLVDEAGFCSDLDYIIRSVLTPLTLLTGGKIILSSTVPPNPNHPFIDYMNNAAEKNALIVKTLFDARDDDLDSPNPRITDKMIQEIIDATPGGIEAPSFQNEYMCRVTYNSNEIVIPEFTQEIQEQCVIEWQKPGFCLKYCGMDIGFSDLTVCLFAYYDFDNAVVVIQDEIVMSGPSMTTDKLAERIKAKEKELWTNQYTGEQEKVYKRVSDNNLIVINDLHRMHNLLFQPTQKDNKEMAINNLRMMISAGEIIISPKCKVLIHHLKNTVWNKQRTDFRRTSDGSHGDACFTPGTKVFTDKGFKNIEDIVIGDKVLSHTGKFNNVLNVMSKNYTGEILQIKPAGGRMIQCTPEHNFYCAEIKKTRTNGLTGQYTIQDHKWIPANNLYKNDSQPVSNLLHQPIIDNNISRVITNELCFLYGYYVAEGSLGGNGSQINFAGHQKETNVLDIIQKAMYTTYGTGYSGKSYQTSLRRKAQTHSPIYKRARLTNNKKTNGRNLTISDNKLWIELKKLGKGINKKFPDWISELNSDQAFFMISGYLFGDGYFSKYGIKSNSISESVAYGLQFLYLKCGISCGIRKQKPGKGFASSNYQYVNKVRSEESLAIINKINTISELSFIFAQKLMRYPISKVSLLPSNYKKIQKIASTPYTGLVYNLEVENDNSYTVDLFSVHNCMALVYLVRNLDKGLSPYPKGYQRSRQFGNGEHFVAFEDEQDKYQGFKDIFEVRKIRRR